MNEKKLVLMTLLTLVVLTGCESKETKMRKKKAQEIIKQVEGAGVKLSKAQKNEIIQEMLNIPAENYKLIYGEQ